MATDFTDKYGKVDYVVVPNSFHADEVDPQTVEPRFRDSPSHITVGYISNITIAKGFDVFLELVEIARNQPVTAATRFKIAGPFRDEKSRDLFYDLIDRDVDMVVEHVGTVSGEEKKAFYESIDLLVLPTRYPNEAQPLVIYEALAHGVPVLATPRGCIRGQLDNGLGWVSKEEEFLQRAMKVLEDPAAIRKRQSVVATAHREGSFSVQPYLEALTRRIQEAEGYS